MTPLTFLAFCALAILSGAIGGVITWLLTGRSRRAVTTERPEDCYTRATLEFWLPEAQCDFFHATRGADWASVVWGMDQWLRDKLRNGQDYPDADTVLDVAREELHNITSECGLTVNIAGV